ANAGAGRQLIDLRSTIGMDRLKNLARGAIARYRRSAAVKGLNTTLLVSLVQTRRIPYPLMRDRGPSARAVGAARDVSRSVHAVLRSPSAPHLRQSVSARTVERQRPQVDATHARPAERPGLVSRFAAFHHALALGGPSVLAAPPRADSGAPGDLGDRRHRVAEARHGVRRRPAAILRRARQGRELPSRRVDGLDRWENGVADLVGAVPAGA